MNLLKILRPTLWGIIQLVIFFHAIVPHPHAEVLTEQQHQELHQEGTSILGFLKIAFHESDNINLDQLFRVRSIVPSDNSSQLSVFSAHCALNEGTYLTIGYNLFKKYTEYFYEDFIIELNGVRGPPILA